MKDSGHELYVMNHNTAVEEVAKVVMEGVDHGLLASGHPAIATHACRVVVLLLPAAFLF